MNGVKGIILSAMAFLFSSNQVFAHGSEDVNEQGLFGNVTMSILLGSALLVLFFAIIYFVTKNKVNRLSVKKKSERDRRNRLQSTLNKLKWAGAISLAALVISGGYAFMSTATEDASQVTLKHIHGLGYNEKGEKIYVPSHDGLRVFSNGQWHVPDGPQHDYMGFSMVDNGFYSSGHPAPGSDMANPFGIIKSTDEGNTINTLALQGETDFHYMDVGYKSHAIYVFNPAPNSRMKEKGFYFSTDEAKTWERARIQGLNGQPSSMAAHPKKSNIIAIGAKNGVYLSKDSGDTFEKILSDIQVTSLTFGHQGDLVIGGIKDKVVIIKQDINTKETVQLKFPAIEEDAISYIAQNPKNPEEITFSTFKKDIYITKDRGNHWHQIADNGEGINLKQEN